MRTSAGKTSITLNPLTPAIGAVAGGLDVAAGLDDDAVTQLHAALAEHLVLFLPGQALSPVQQRDFAARFGKLYTHPFHPGAGDAPEVMVLDHDEHRRAAQNDWHTDVTFIETPPQIEILYGEIVPAAGGDTCWASMYAAYEALSPALRAFLDGLHAVHDFAKDFPPSRFAQHEREGAMDVYAANAPVTHPVVRTNPATGRKALFVNSSFTTQIVELHARESAALLAFLYAHVGQPEFNVRWHWTAGDLVMWDNRWTQHYAVSDYFPAHRRVRRVSVLGDRPV